MGGIAGLCAGIALHDAGYDVEVYERSDSTQQAGHGLCLWPNGAKALNALGLEAAMSLQVILDSIGDEEWMPNLQYWHDDCHRTRQTLTLTDEGKLVPTDDPAQPQKRSG